jgi:pimeloyl-ACP methyl ester carboxylesterase
MTPHGGQDAGVPLIAVNGIELYYESHGTGAPLVVLGGLGLDVSEMGMLTGPLAARFRVIAADNRGAGRSAKPPGPYSVEQMAADVAGLMDRLDLPRAHVLGMSLGGRIAMALALAESARVNRLVLVATSPRAAGARWRVRAGMVVADLPVLRGRPHRARHDRPRGPGRHGQADARSDPPLTARPDRRRPPGPAAHPARTTHRRGQRVPDGKRLTAYRSPGCGPGTKPRVVTGATGRPDARS